MHKQEPNWYPPEMIPMYLDLSAGMLDSSLEQLANLEQVKHKPHVLEDSIVERIIKLHTEQNNDDWIVIEQCKRWRKKKLSAKQLRDIAEIERNAKQLHDTNEQILFLVNHIKDYTIDKVLAKDDLTSALDFLSGKTYLNFDEDEPKSQLDFSNPSFQEKIEKAKKVKFQLPPKVSSRKTRLPDGHMAYVYRHEDLGELGRMVIIPRGNQSQFTFEVAGEPDDPMTQKRLEILEPMSKEILDNMAAICGEGDGEFRVSRRSVKILGHPSPQNRELSATIVLGPGRPASVAPRHFAPPELLPQMAGRLDLGSTPVDYRPSASPLHGLQRENYSSYKDRKRVECKIMPCEKCGQPVAILVFVEDVYTEDGLEDYARIMYPKLKELNVPTWIIGKGDEVTVNGEKAAKALTMKVWPNRSKAKQTISTTLNDKLDKLIREHCATNKKHIIE